MPNETRSFETLFAAVESYLAQWRMLADIYANHPSEVIAQKAFECMESAESCCDYYKTATDLLKL